MSILVPGTANTAKTVSIRVAWGSAGLTGKIVKAGTPLAIDGKIANSKKARGIVVSDYGYSPYANECPCYVAGIVDLAKAQASYGSSYANDLFAALDQITFIDADGNAVSKITTDSLADGAVTVEKLSFPPMSYIKIHAIRVELDEDVALLDGDPEESEEAAVMRTDLGIVDRIPIIADDTLWQDFVGTTANPVVINPEDSSPQKCFSTVQGDEEYVAALVPSLVELHGYLILYEYCDPETLELSSPLSLEAAPQTGESAGKEYFVELDLTQA